jgi:protease I
MRLKGKKIALFLENFYEDQEFWYPYQRLREEGAELTVIAPRADTYTSKHNVPAKADLAVDKARAKRFDALVILASAEVVTGRKVTSFFSIKDDLVHSGAEWVDEEVVRDGNLITSRTPDDLPVFCRALIEALE